MKLKALLGIGLVIASLTLVGCSAGEEEIDVARTKTVEVEAVSNTSIDDVLVYYGHVESGQMTKLSFKSSGVLNEVYVVKGQSVAMGDPIASLDASDYSIQLEAARDGAQSVYASLNKATEAYNSAVGDYEDYEKLYEAGSISQSSLEKAKLNVDVSLQDVTAAREGYQQALRNVEALSKSVDELQMTSSVDGIVVEILYQPNEAVAAGYPVVVVRSDDAVFKTSIAQKDLKALELGQEVTLTFDEVSYRGTITLIGNTPDEVTRTFEVEVAIDGDVPLGTVGESRFVIGTYEGIIIPLEVVVKGDFDYVYVIEDGVAHKKPVEIINRVDDMLLVEGLELGDLLVMKGYNRLNDGDVVNVLNEVAN